FVKPRRQRPAPLEPADGSLDDVPPTVGRLVEPLVPRLVLAGRDDRLDVATPQPAADARVTVSLVRGRLPGPPRLARPPRPPAARGPARPAHGPIGRAASAPRPGRDPPPQVGPAPVTARVRLGAEAPPGTAQRVALRLRHAHGHWPPEFGRPARIFSPPRPRP